MTQSEHNATTLAMLSAHASATTAFQYLCLSCLCRATCCCVQAWLRSRGETSGAVYTADTIADRFGVVKSSYDCVPLPARSVLSAVCNGAGKPQEQLQLVAAPLPVELEWGQVGFGLGGLFRILELEAWTQTLPGSAAILLGTSMLHG